jgi:hypothetical protein
MANLEAQRPRCEDKTFPKSAALALGAAVPALDKMLPRHPVPHVRSEIEAGKFDRIGGGVTEKQLFARTVVRTLEPNT